MNETEKKKIYIFPTKSTKRIGAYLADFLLMIILGVLLLEGLILQIYRPVIGYYSMLDESSLISQKEVELYYDNKILFYNTTEKYSFSKNLKTTGDKYVSYLITSSSDQSSDVFNTFFINIRKYDKKYLNNLYLKYGDKYYDSTMYKSDGYYPLKDTYIDEFKHKFISGDEMSEIAKSDYDDFINSSFLKVYSEVVNDIKQNNLYDERRTTSFLTYENRVKEINLSISNMYIYGSVISFVLSTFILYFFVPFIDKKGRTLSFIILKIERIRLDNYEYLNHRLILSTYLISLLTNAVGLMFLPLMSVEFATLFSFTLLVIISGISFIFVLVDLAILLSNNLKRGVSELLTHSLVVDASTMDNYYKEIENGRE